jgi:hypothetical protein
MVKLKGKEWKELQGNGEVAGKGKEGIKGKGKSYRKRRGMKVEGKWRERKN